VGLISTGDGDDGVRGETNSTNGVAGYGSGTDVNGVYGYSSGGYAGYFDGNVFTTGSYLPSDRTLKQNIADFTSALAIISKLQPKTYEYKQDGNYKLMHLPEGTRYGLIAQDVAQVLPGLVRNSAFQTRWANPHKPGAKTNQANETISFQAVNYTELIPIVVKGMQELQAENQALKEENAVLNERLNKIEALLGANNSSTVSLARLEQNTPNPVHGMTTIRYQLPLNAATAHITITNAKGQLVQTLTLSSRGNGQVQFNSAALAAGTYNYTLWVNNTQADTKRFVVAR